MEPFKGHCVFWCAILAAGKIVVVPSDDLDLSGKINAHANLECERLIALSVSGTRPEVPSLYWMRCLAETRSFLATRCLHTPSVDHFPQTQPLVSRTQMISFDPHIALPAGRRIVDEQCTAHGGSYSYVHESCDVMSSQMGSHIDALN
jgi:hypothetical protein